MAQLLSNLPIGAKVKFGKYSVNGETAQPIIWLIVSKNTDATSPSKPQNSVTLLTEKAIDFRCFDAREPNSNYEDVKTDGYSRYAYSNLGQWLNSDATAGAWYVSQHQYDQSPIVEMVINNTPYAQRPGFLNHFTIAEKMAILTTTIETVRTKYEGSGIDIVSQKVFIPSVSELSTRWLYFTQGGSLKCYATDQANTNSTATYIYPGESLSWWTRDAYSDALYEVSYVTSSGAISSDGFAACVGRLGVRPALNLPFSLTISDTTDTDGCYTAIWNSTPSVPSILNVPPIYGGKSNAITWSSATDPDGDTVTYTLECSLNGGEYSQIYSGTSTVYAHLVPFGTTSVTYRVKATDPSGESSAYTISATKTVVNNNAPEISGKDDNLGVKRSGFTGTYKVTDANNNTVTVTESIDGVQIRSLVATLGQEIAYGITGDTWLTLANGSHTLTIRATDGIESTVRTYIFTKLVETLTIRNSSPWVSTTMPSRIMLVITRNIPLEAMFKVEVCNNGYDTTPTWEDCTDAVKSGLVHVFTNESKSASDWGVLVRVTVNRNGATGACYISAIGGNFE